MTTDPRRLSVHVLGAAKGESIVLQLPNGRWGVVDCYARSLNDPETNPTLMFLRESGVEKLEFLCLTHPHDDHYRGMSQVLGEFPVEYFWHFGAQSAAHFKQLVNYLRKEAIRTGDQEAMDNANEYTRIWLEVHSGHKAGKTRLKTSRPGMPLYPVPADPDASFQIVGLAPSDNQAQDYHQTFAICFDDQGRFRERLPQSHHNRISVGLRIKFGATRIILGGDVERPGWLDVMQEVRGEDLAAHLVKVSHHGSENGYCDGLWPCFSAQGKPYAVITAYASQSLPRSRALELIGGHAQSILLTCGTVWKPSEWPKDIEAEVFKSRLALYHKMKQTLGDEATHECGRWSMIYDDQGQCLSRVAQPPAIDLSEVMAATRV
jgi:hypothetical protein